MTRALTPSHATVFPKWLTLYLPIFIALYPLLLALPGMDWEAHVYREYGLIENTTVLCLALAIFWAAKALIKTSGWFQRSWLLLLALGAFVFLGEEISWGQHFFQWTTPEEWKAINKQRETSLHNVEGLSEFLFTKVARNGLCFGAIFGSIIAPWWLRRRPHLTLPGSLHFWLWPSSQTAMVALMANLTVVPRKIARIWDYQLPHYYGMDDGEMKECYLALYIMLYALVMWRMSRVGFGVDKGSQSS
jgi:hypothetical protein